MNFMCVGCVCVGIFKDVKEYTCREEREGKSSHTDSSKEQIFPLKGMLWEAAAPLGIDMCELSSFWVMDFSSAQLCHSDVQAPSPPYSQFVE